MIATAWHALAAPWEDGIVRRALLDVVLLAVAAGALSCWVVLYDLAYGAESLSHGMLPGLVVAALAGGSLTAGAAAGTGMAVLALAAVTRVPGVSRDTAVGVAIPTLFGLGVLLALSPATPAGLETLLFGDPLGATDGDLVLAAALAVAVPATLARARHRLLAVGLERGGARGLGVRAGRVELLLLALLAATALVAVQGLGTLLVVALLVAPAVVARGVAHRLGALLVVAPVAAVALGVAGVYLSYYAGVAAGAAVAGLLVAGAALSGAARALRGRTWWAARARGPRPAPW